MIVVIGESIVDRVGGTSRPGGSPANVAVGLGRLGANVALLTELGSDSEGDLIRAHLVESGVGILDQRVPRTSTATALIAPDGSATYKFEVGWTLRAVPLPARTQAVHVGSLGAVMRPGALAVVEMLSGLDPDVVISYDPNIREVMRPFDLEAMDAMAGRAHLIKASDEDLAQLHPDVPAGTVAERWLAAGADLVVVTAAAAGSIAYSAAGEIHQPAVPVNLVDTVGAGDAYMAALLHALLGRLPAELSAPTIAAALEFAARAAGIVCGRVGADPAWAHELA